MASTRQPPLTLAPARLPTTRITPLVALATAMQVPQASAWVEATCTCMSIQALE